MSVEASLDAGPWAVGVTGHWTEVCGPRPILDQGAGEREAVL